MATVYRNSQGRFSTELGASFKDVDGKHFVRLWGRWAELKSVTPEVFWSRMRKVAEAQRRACDGRVQPSPV